MPSDASNEETLPELIPWHRLLGLVFTDLYTGTRFDVELEMDLSRIKQLLDFILLERRDGPPLVDPPDGLEDPARFNLITYKSHREPLNAWALHELLGHYVNCRKQLSPERKKLFPESDFKLIAVCTRFPAKLAGQVRLTPVKPGVYNVIWGVRPITLIVTPQVARVARNAIWELFSADPERVEEGARRYRFKREDLSTVVGELYKMYSLEGIQMPYTVEDYKRGLRQEAINDLLRANHRKERMELLSRLPAEERLEGLDPEELAQRLPPEARLKGLDPEERLKGLDPEERLQGLDPEERLKGLDPDELAQRLPPEARLKGLTRQQIIDFLSKLEDVPESAE